jgi:signal transduction histidine kinase
MKYFLSVILIVLLTGSFLNGQYDKSKIKASMVYYFAQYTTWPEEKNIDQFKIAVLSVDTNVYNELKGIANYYRLKNKPISVITVAENSIPSDIQILYVSSEYSRKIPRIAEKISGKHILMVSDECHNGLFSMINLYREKEEKTIAFQINRQNLDAEGFKYSNELLLQGGSLIDLKELYKATASKLDIEITRLKSIQNQNETLTIEAEKLKNELVTYKNQIDSLSALVISKEIRLSDVIQAINEKELLFLKKKTELELMQKELLGLEDSIHFRDNLLYDKIFEIKGLNDSISIKHKLNAQKDNELIIKDQLIKTRERNTLILLAIIVAFIFAAYLGFRGYRVNKVLNMELEKIVEERTSELEKHKNHLEELVDERAGEVKKLNIRLEQSNKELSYSNTVLEDTNNELILQRSEIEVLNNELLQKNEELFSINESLVQKTSELEDALKVITETKNQLIQSEKMASLGLLVAGIAHEINNPINFISAGVQALQRIQEQINLLLSAYESQTNQIKLQSKELKGANSAEIIAKSQKILKNMLDGVDRIDEIIQSLSNYSRNEEGNIREHNIEETIKGTLVILHNRYKDRIKITEHYYD